MRLLLATVFSAVLLAPAWSAPIATLTFKTPTGTVADTDSIDVWLTIALDGASDPLQSDAFGALLTLPSLADVAAGLFSGLPAGVDENSADRAGLNVAFGCSTNFTSGCLGGPPYSFNFNYLAPSFIGAQALDLQPGSATDFLFGTFTPDGGRAPAGTYTFPYAAFFIQVFDTTREQPGFPGSWLHIADVPIASTGDQPSFTRDVVSTLDTSAPEPATYTFMLAGLALVVGMKRRS